MSLAVSQQPDSSAGKIRQSFSRLPDILDVPNLVQVQLDSYNHFRDQGLLELLGEVSPIQDVAREALPSDLLANNSIQEIISIVYERGRFSSSDVIRVSSIMQIVALGVVPCSINQIVNRSYYVQQRY